MQAVIERLHASPLRCVIITTGAGGSAIARLMGVAGCSRTLLDAQVPYLQTATQLLIDHHPKRYLSAQVGLDLAQLAFQRAEHLLTAARIDMNLLNTVGLGATAAIQTERTRKGEDAVYVSCWHRGGVDSYRVRLSKEKTRLEQEELIGNVMLYALAASEPSIADVPLTALGLSVAGASVDDTVTTDNVLYCRRVAHGERPIRQLLQGEVPRVVFNSHGLARCSTPPYSDENIDPEEGIYLLYPGSFHPLHWGHTELARVASNVVQLRDQQKRTLPGSAIDELPPLRPVVLTYEISATIVGKRDLHENDIVARIEQFTSSGKRVAVTTAKLFIEKAKMFPNHGLVVGIDTAERVLDPRYYSDSSEQMISAISDIRKLGCYFVVGGRLKDKEWVDLSSLKVPAELADMFVPILQHDFRVDISSTELRARQATPPPTPYIGSAAASPRGPL